MSRKSDRMDRREFFGRSAAIGVGIAALSRGVAVAQDAPPRSTVVHAARPDACVDMAPNSPAVVEMVNAVVMGLSGRTDPAEAWRQYVGPDDVVGVKINCLFGVGASTHPEVTAAVVAGCRLAGVPEDNIIVWDRTDRDLIKTGYEIHRGAGVKTLGVNNDWEDEAVDIHDCRGRLAKVLTQTCTAIINVPILKTHGISGITLSLKNHYGSFHNPGEAHGNNCDPYLAELNSLAPIREKERLIICDALLPVADGGPRAQPQWTWENNAILAATDPVAVDYVGLKILDARREQVGRPSVEQSGRAKHIFTAAAAGLGVADMARIELVEV